MIWMSATCRLTVLLLSLSEEPSRTDLRQAHKPLVQRHFDSVWIELWLINPNSRSRLGGNAKKIGADMSSLVASFAASAVATLWGPYSLRILTRAWLLFGLFHYWSRKLPALGPFLSWALEVRRYFLRPAENLSLTKPPGELGEGGN